MRFVSFDAVLQLPMTGIQIDDVRNGGDGAVQHFFFHAFRGADDVRLILQTKLICEKVFQLFNKIIIGRFIGVGALLTVKEGTDLFQ